MMRKDLLGLEELEAQEILDILDTAEAFREVIDRPIKKVPTLRGKTVANLFYEPSTRTRISFELAEKRLSADSFSFSKATSSVVKGETLKDTVKNIEAMMVDFVVVRHGASGAPHFIAKNIAASVINAGDGQHEHPTQGLLDMFTMRRVKGDLAGLKVVIVGDVTHSRVARSNIWGLTKLGADVHVAGPTTLTPREIEKMGVTTTWKVEEALEGADVVNVLRIQKERQDANLLPSLREYAIHFGVTQERLKRAKSDVVIMHPGPMNRGVEIAQDVAEDERNVILEQVTNGVAARMAVLYLLNGGKPVSSEKAMEAVEV
ncbi:MAG: aspartate carbamoyltransferase catalytic subunit [Candidatus Eisenbacteria bacterium]|uniref:Aspartate carbamoyltransferase n=1 Tax=Eiseniibacteriota bacterium TaxID=2212470 RepID=A0A7Y2ECP0_UNCEI|nr:aspartate carbamoyltransferase catalytic subunit [Candidatus Eisenbacteria bacterium]